MTTTIILEGKELTFNCESEVTNGVFTTKTSADGTMSINNCLGEMFLCKTAWMLENGMSECYDNIGEYMIDAIMDLPWSTQGHEIVKKHVQGHKHYKYILGIFSNKYPHCEMF